MAKVWLALTGILVGTLCAAALAAPSARVVKIASDDWCPYICADHNKIVGGFLVDLTEQALALQQYELKSVFLPLNRAMIMAEEGLIDGVYAPALDNRLRLSKPMAYSRACFYTLKDNEWQYHDLKSLHDVTIGVIADYGYDGGPFDRLLAAPTSHGVLFDFNKGQTAGETNLSKLLTKRYPVMLEHQAVMDHLTDRLGVSSQIRKAGCLEQPLMLVIGIAKRNPAASNLIRAIDTGLDQLKASGQLDPLKKKYRLEE
ncbi:transporter substrate-binding domain-containing protein [Paludibacterium purpuratum]|uniref:Amino acid ABC transporter substrate-binding protein (PAAT family) n=1 Tax=Paludibacterium purpuratum TaxID=1144873 RepID=A0A4R7B3R6_9NEIS|nr:transporter substrate-binding domain-containing protein [Paludibacterium purpuratum]TDR76625.1 amino acid ABC transporter substrate-binding protein (PAAT family) [Paludibacterium purpuratum]